MLPQATLPRATTETLSVAPQRPILQLYMAKLRRAREAKKEEMDAKTDWDRMEGADPRDPRTLGGPCRGEHTMPSDWASNQSGRYKHCVTCGLRLMYVPLKGASGEHRTPGPTPAIVTMALDNIKRDYGDNVVKIGDNTSKITGKLVKDSITAAEVRQRMENRMATNTNNELNELTVDTLGPTPSAPQTVKTKSNKADEAPKPQVQAENASAASASAPLTPEAQDTGGTVPMTAGDSVTPFVDSVTPRIPVDTLGPTASAPQTPPAPELPEVHRLSPRAQTSEASWVKLTSWSSDSSGQGY